MGTMDSGINSSIEIEVTPEMIEAAREAMEPFYEREGYYDTSNECLTAIFRRMLKAGGDGKAP